MLQSFNSSKYYALPVLHQRILQIRALIYHTQRKTDFVNYLIKSDLNQLNLGPILGYLTKNKFLDKQYNLKPEFSHYLAVLALSDNNPHAKNNLEIISKIVDLKNPVRLKRALEVSAQTGKPYSQLRSNSKKERFYSKIKYNS